MTQKYESEQNLEPTFSSFLDHSIGFVIWRHANQVLTQYIEAFEFAHDFW